MRNTCLPHQNEMRQPNSRQYILPIIEFMLNRGLQKLIPHQKTQKHYLPSYHKIQEETLNYQVSLVITFNLSLLANLPLYN
jgi:hypothetical protein